MSCKHAFLHVVCTLLIMTSMYVRGATEDDMRTLMYAKLNSTSYTPRVRPIKDTGQILNVTIDMYLVAINTVDEVEQMVTSTSYMTIAWSDTFMTWTPADYGGLTTFEVPQDAIWKPDLALANAFDTISGLGDKFMYLSITHEGVITWRPYQVFDSSCSMDMTYFPFDSQTCDIQLVTWSSTSDMISIQTGAAGIDTTYYETNANWDLLAATTFDSSDSKTSGRSFRLHIKRKPIYYLVNFIIPIVLLSVLNTFVFALPCDSGEKSGYAMVLFLSFAVFLLIVTEIMPEGMNTIPIMSTYLLLECILSTIIVFITIIQLRMHNMGDDIPIPLFLRSFVKSVNAIKHKLSCDRNTERKMEKEREGSLSPPPNYEDIDSENPGAKRRATGRSRNQKTFIEQDESDSEKSGCLPCWKSSSKTDIEMVTMDESLATSCAKTNRKLADVFGARNKVAPDEYFNNPPVRTVYRTNQKSAGAGDDILSATPVPGNMNKQVGVGLREIGTPPRMITSPVYETELIPEPSHTPEPEVELEPEKEVTWQNVALAFDTLFFTLFFALNMVAIIVVFGAAGAG
ncbi:ACHA6-like protein [Mya arenaria]|uniref:ACHA6-like protein n=1 Tax=Mya arenaria TaxID=6604 RepID=A0ABY7FIN6_MYAAR|nr:acetylcholine receptor subunit alpha-like [Mya arenaria]WAR20907.1 ACHA6-like protein [Mya arenaria]